MPGEGEDITWGDVDAIWPWPNQEPAGFIMTGRALRHFLEVGNPAAERGPIALSLCTTAHPLYTRFTNIIGASIFEPTMRPNPRCRVRLRIS